MASHIKAPRHYQKMDTQGNPVPPYIPVAYYHSTDSEGQSRPRLNPPFWCQWNQVVRFASGDKNLPRILPALTSVTESVKTSG